MRRLFLCSMAIFFSTSFFLIACSKDIDPVNTDSEGVAIKGYDPVAYFTLNRPVEGKKRLQHEWQGAKWYFSDIKHQEMFAMSPETYAPKYGGYCAFAVSRGTTADIDPEAWAIVDGKLYLNLNKDIQNAWQQDRDNYIKKADANWPRIIKK